MVALVSKPLVLPVVPTCRSVIALIGSSCSLFLPGVIQAIGAESGPTFLIDHVLEVLYLLKEV